MGHSCCGHSDACSGMGIDGAKLVVADTQDARETVKKARPRGQSIQDSDWGYKGYSEDAKRSQI